MSRRSDKEIPQVALKLPQGALKLPHEASEAPRTYRGPPREDNETTPASWANTRYRTGFPIQDAPGELSDTGSAPEWPDKGAAKHNDFYRDSVKKYQIEGQVVPANMPADSPYRRNYENYKASDVVASGLNRQVKDHNRQRNDAQAAGRRISHWEDHHWRQRGRQLNDQAKKAWEK